MNISMKIPGAGWADDSDGITSPFFFLPLDLALNAGETTARIITNISGQTAFPMIDAGTDTNNIDDNEGYFTCEGGTAGEDGDGVWPGSGHDATGDQVFDMFDILDTGTNPDGRILLMNWRMKTGATTGQNPMVTFGQADSAANHGWQLRHIPASDETGMWIFQPDGTFKANQTLHDATVNGSVEYALTTILDTKNNIISMYVDGVEGGFSAEKAVILGEKGDYSAGLQDIGLSIFAFDTTYTADARTFAASGDGLFRDFFAIDLTSQSAQPDYDTIATAFSKTPAGCIPHLMSAF